MNVYIDKSNLLSVIHSVNHDKYNDCMRMLKDNYDIFLTFSKNEIDGEDKKDILLWLTRMAEGINRKEHIKWGCDFPKRPLDTSTFTPSELSSVYCLSKDKDSKLESRINEGNLIIACEGQEIEKLSSLFFDSYQYTRNIFHKVKSWEDLNQYTSPCTDIIITDMYLFSNPELYQRNIYSLIRVLGKKKAHINIVIFTLKSQYNKESKIAFEPDWDSIYTKIRKCADKYSSFNVTFVTASKETLEEHDRTIFTNYKSFASGDSYNYFDTNGNKITNGRHLHVHSHADNDNEEDSIKFLEDMQNIIDSISKLNNSSLIKKDKKSNFLKFS